MQMHRAFLFIAATGIPGVLWAQPRNLADDAGNWPVIAAGGGRFFFALAAGILFAFAFQWILTLLSLATGLSTRAGYPGKRRRYYREESTTISRDYDGYESEEETPVKKIAMGIGIWAMVTTAISMFFACWFASELIRFGTRSENVLVGLTIWAGFMAAMVWLDTSPLASVLGILVAAFKEGLKLDTSLASANTGIAGSPAAIHAMGDEADDDTAVIAAKVRQEFREKNGHGFRDRLRSYLSNMQPRSPDRSEIEREADRFFEDAEILEAAQEGSLQTLERRSFQEIAASRSDIPAEESEQWVDAIHSRWNRLVEAGRGTGALIAEELLAEPIGGGTAQPLNPKESLIPESTAPFSVSGSGASASSTPGAPSAPGASSAQGASSSQGAPSAQGTPPVQGTPPAVLARFQLFKKFLSTADRRELNPVRIEEEVQLLVLHPEEGYATMERTIKELKRDELVKVMRQRRDISQQEADSIADLIDSARARMLSRAEIREHRSQETTNRALSRIRDHVYSLKRPGLDYEGFQRDLTRMLEDSAGESDSGVIRVPDIDHESILAEIAARKEISRAETEQLVVMSQQALRTVRENARRMEEETSRRLDAHRRSLFAKAESTRRMASTAAWWLFGIAVVSAAVSALGGSMAARI